MLTTLWRTTSSTRTFRISSSSCARSSCSLGCSPPGWAPSAPPVGSSGVIALCTLPLSGPGHALGGVGALRLLDRVAVDLLDRGPLGEGAVGALGSVLLRQLDLDPKQAAGRLGPLDQFLEHRPGGRGAPIAEVDHLAVHSVADRPPQVLLDLPLAEQLPAPGVAELVVLEGHLGGAGRNQRG